MALMAEYNSAGGAAVTRVKSRCTKENKRISCILHNQLSTTAATFSERKVSPLKNTYGKSSF